MTLTPSVLLSYLWLAIPSRIFLDNRAIVVVVLGFCFETLSKSRKWMGRKTSPFNFRSGLLKCTIAL